MIHLILTDIEGTISPITFVKEILFPYARKHLSDYVQGHQNSPQVREIMLQSEKICGAKLSVDEVISTLIKWLDEDQKITPLKTIQGLIWEQGFKKEVFKAQIYPDSLEKLKKWKDGGMPIYVYSSGSIFAQRMFFQYNEAGDINCLFSGYFDTTIGNKKEKSSYEQIALKTNTRLKNILFLSDIVEELDAASEAGMKTLLINRSNQKIKCNHKSFSNFSDIDLISLQTWRQKSFQSQ